MGMGMGMHRSDGHFGNNSSVEVFSFSFFLFNFLSVLLLPTFEFEGASIVSYERTNDKLDSFFANSNHGYKLLCNYLLLQHDTTKQNKTKHMHSGRTQGVRSLQ
mmetsp:Transcript_26702/g.73450  ORF Transcript_26702/g.73450 Transcript_26702/m.73450 type:complete len:104 (-) Transcript_26702:239-550(-)